MRFEDFLSRKFLAAEPWHLDDAMPEAFNHWLSTLEVADLLEWGEEYGQSVADETRLIVEEEIIKRI